MTPSVFWASCWRIGQAGLQRRITQHRAPRWRSTSKRRSTQDLKKEFSDVVKSWDKSLPLPGFTIILECSSTGTDIYKLIVSWVDAVEFDIDTIAVTPIRTNLPKSDFSYPGVQCRTVSMPPSTKDRNHGASISGCARSEESLQKSGPIGTGS